MHVGLSQLQFITSLGCACPCLGVGVGVHSDKTKATLPLERKFRRWAAVLTQCVRQPYPRKPMMCYLWNKS